MVDFRKHLRSSPTATSSRRTFHVDHEVTIWCEDPRKVASGRERYFARLWDPRAAIHCGGSGTTALEALAWCLDSYVRRALLGLPPQIACHPKARPGDGLAELGEAA